MRRTIHVISSGRYSDYTIYAIVEEPEGRDFRADVAEFIRHCQPREVEPQRRAESLQLYLRKLGYTEFNFDDANAPRWGEEISMEKPPPQTWRFASDPFGP